MSAARIGKITMKAGGAEVRVLRRETPNPGDQNWRGELLKAARTISEQGELGSKLCGFVVIGLFEDGSSSCGWRYDPESSVMPRLLLPTYISELIRRELITEPQACDVVNRANGFEES